MEPKYLAFRRWLYTPIILWQGDWIPRVCFWFILSCSSYLPNWNLVLSKLNWATKKRQSTPSFQLCSSLSHVTCQLGRAKKSSIRSDLIFPKEARNSSPIHFRINLLFRYCSFLRDDSTAIYINQPTNQPTNQLLLLLLLLLLVVVVVVAAPWLTLG